MPKVFIEKFTSTKQHHIFTGKNALKHALFFEKTGRVCNNEQLLYNMDIKFQKGVWWDSSGGGSHAKIYETKDSIIYSSQNNGNSPLFEFAILYPRQSGKPSKLEEFTAKTLKRVAAYRTWWAANKKEWR